jgi:carbon monoxide dehydrogenase subunit G
VIRVETSTTIERPVEDVAAYLTDIERMTEWTDMTASRRLTDGPIREGSRAYGEVAMGPVKLGWTYQITDMQPSGGYGYKTVSKSALGMDGRVALAPQGPNSTKVDYLAEIHTHGLLRLLEPLLRSEISRNEAGEVTRLKARLEGATA